MAQRETFEIEQPPVKVQPVYNNLPKKKGLFGPKPRWTDFPDREVIANCPDLALCDNAISTSKYTALTFLPMNIFIQFSRPANLYFLVIGLLQMINEISISGGEPVIFLPLFFIVSVSMIKDLAEDYKRKKSDTAENLKPMKRINNRRIEISKWKNARVGDIIKIQNNEYFPCDMVLVGSSDIKGVGYVETKNLDGETNLKHKVVPKELRKILDCEEEMMNNRVKFIYEKPNPYLYTFTGTIVVGDKLKIPCDNSNFVLRGMSLRNTEWVYGMVAYTGHDTKIMLNSINAKPKKSGLEIKMQREIYIIFLFQLLLCLGCGIWYSYWTENNLTDTPYLDYTGAFPFWGNVLVRAGNWLLMFTNFVPISLIVTLEMVKVFQGMAMSTDKNMKEPINNIYVTVQSSALNEELGQIDHIFSDKTGTLTCNLMEFKKLCVNGKPYGINRNLDTSAYPKVSNVDFQDKAFVDVLNDTTHREHKGIHEYLLFLGLCHTIITQKQGDDIIYNAASPDEFALVNFARFMGYEFRGIDEQNNMVINVRGKELKYKLHHVLEFNSTRKRMSVIIEDSQGNIKLLCKGADSIILKRMKMDNPDIKHTNDHLEDFANQGLRTLLLAQKTIPKAEYKEWTAKYLEASTSIKERDAKIEAVQELIELNLELVGATAIEDKLQDKVGETIERMKDTGIKVWVLTGDKVETAINIAFSCNLFNNNYYKCIIDGTDLAKVKEQIKKAQEKLSPIIKNALIITGDALIHAMDKELSGELMKICDACESVVCCRVSPKQKQEVVSLVRREKPTATTLSIGDGANDVNMIIAAHVGIGIRGVEGQQAARASDYAVGEFKCLQNLLLVHGRECYRRNSLLILYNFYKNIVLVSPQFWFGFLSVFSGQTVYQPLIYQGFNMVFASFPIIIYAVYDREYEDNTLLKHSQFYVEGRNNVHFNTKKYWSWFFSSFIQGLILLVLVDYVMNESAIGDGIGYTGSFWINGNVVLQVVVFATNLKVLLFSSRFSVLLVGTVTASILSFFGIYYVFNLWTGSDLYGTFQIYGMSWDTWHITLLCICGTTMLDLGATRFFELQREDLRFKKVEANFSRGTELDISFLDDDFEEKYKGFAFSQEEASDEHSKRNYMM